MKVLVIGSGGREHALAWKIAQSPMVEKVWCAPGNGGTGDVAENVAIAANDSAALVKFALEKQVGLVVVGPEDPLVAGIVDQMTAAGIKAFGPSAAAAELEGSKAFSKEIMRKYNIPTAEFRTFTDYQNALNYVNQRTQFPVVIKASGLAAGKGVLICADRSEAVAALDGLMQDKMLGDAGNEIVVEDFLDGEEISLFAITDGENYRLLLPSQDHKKIGEGDNGKNTGGMGAYAPAPVADAETIKAIESQIVIPTLQGMHKEGKPFKGLLYVGVIKTSTGVKTLEYNCRFGDPETEIVLPMLKSDLVPLLLASIDGRLEETELEMHEGFGIDVVIASGGYPDAYEKGKVISGLDKMGKEILVFHAGTKNVDGKIVTSGGRVLNIVARGNTFAEAKAKVYQAIAQIEFEGMYFRKDIGFRFKE
jgi:phosphoribosylamine--glycine ligase